MQLHGIPRHRHRAPLHLDLATARAAEIAMSRAESALYAGRLLSPGEALAIACGEARNKETLFSIARTVAWETHTDVDIVEAILNEHFPDLAK